MRRREGNKRREGSTAITTIVSIKTLDDMIHNRIKKKKVEMPNERAVTVSSVPK
jgi:hypothetical protein